MKDSIDSVQQHTQQYWNIDGLAEIAIGIFFLLLSLNFFAIIFLPNGPVRLFLGVAGTPLLVILAIWAGKRGVEALKTSLTYPRTGYIAYHRPSKKRRWISLAIGVVITGLLLFLIYVFNLKSGAWMPLADGIFLGMLLLLINRGLLRFYLLTALSFLSGFLLAYANATGNLGHAAFYGLMGSALVLSGSLTLRSYLIRNPSAVEDEL
jgi:hypothetical protein